MQKITFLFILSLLCQVVNATEGLLLSGQPDLKSISVLEFTPDGTLLIGDSKAGAIFAIRLEEDPSEGSNEAPNKSDVEGDVAALLGATRDDILIHDLAVNPVSKNVYLSVSRSRANWTSRWQLPNEVGDATLLVRITPAGEYEIPTLENVSYTKATLPNPVSEDKFNDWKKVSERVNAITDLAVSGNKIYVAGLSNEEFASSMWVIDYPFQDKVSATTLEIFHGAHGKYETHSPVRAFLPYELNKRQHLLAAYLCTPLVTFETGAIQDGQHIKGKTVAEFGSGNYPLDMLIYQNNGRDLILMSNSQLPLLIFDPKDVETFEGEITEEVQGYLAGVKYTPRSGSGIQQLADFDEKVILATQRMPGGSLALTSLPKDRLNP